MSEEKIRFQMRISPDTDRRIKAAMPLDNVRSQNEFVENALRFYCGYLSAKDATEYLTQMLGATLRGTLETFSNRYSRDSFRLAVEVSYLANVIAGELELPYQLQEKYRGRAITAVKKTNGRIFVDEAEQ